MMLHSGDLAARREQLVEVASPTRRVVAGPMSADGRPTQHRFDAPARPIGGLRLFLPNGLQNLQDERGIDRVDGKVVYRCREGRKLPLPAPRLIEGGDPLIAVFRVPPAGPVRLDVMVRALLERDRPRGWRAGRAPRRLSLLDRAQPVLNLQAGVCGPFAGLGEAHGMQGAEAHLSGDAVDHVSEQPRLGSEFAHLEIEAVPIAVETGLVRCAGSPKEVSLLPSRMWAELVDEQSYAQL